MDKRIIKRSAADVNWQDKGEAWLADLSAGDVFRLDCCWAFRLRRDAAAFLARVDSGIPADVAYYRGR